MSDINEEQKRLYKRAEENDYIVKDIAQYEENDSELAKYTILELQNRINKAVEYIEYYGNLFCLKHKQFKEYHQYEVLLNILKGDNK